MKSQDIDHFISSFSVVGTVTQVSDYEQIFATDNFGDYVASDPEKNLFFLSGIKDTPKAYKKGARHTSDSDIESKKYIVLDFDVRKEIHPEYTDEEIKDWGCQLANQIEDYELFKDWSYLNFSGNGIHIFYIGDAVGISAESYRDGVEYLQKEFERLTGFKPDAKCKNIARIFRVPGSYNQKNTPPNLVEIIMQRDRHSDLLGKLEEFSKLNIKTKPEEFTRVAPDKSGGYESIFDWVTAQDQKWCLERISDTEIVGFEHYDFKSRGTKGGWSIICNGHPCMGWIDTDNLIHGTGRDTIIFWRKKCKNAPSYEKGELAKKLEALFPEFKSTFVPIPSKQVPTPAVNNPEAKVEPKISLVNIKDMMAEAWDEINNFDPQSLIGFGYDFLDDKLGGIFPGDLVLLGGITGTGKTTISIRIAEKAARLGKKVIIATLEDRLATRAKRMGIYEINRMRSERGGQRFMDLKDVLTGKTKVEKSEWDAAMLRLAEVFYVKTSGKLTPEDLSVIYAEKADLYVIDHLHYFSLHNKNVSRADSIQEAMQTINDMTKQSGTRTILVAHFKGLDESKRPTQSDFKDSISIAQTADTTIILWRDKRNEEGSSDQRNLEKQNITEFIIPKNRIDQPSMVIEAVFNPSMNDYQEHTKIKFGTKNSDVPVQIKSFI